MCNRCGLKGGLSPAFPMGGVSLRTRSEICFFPRCAGQGLVQRTEPSCSSLLPDSITVPQALGGPAQGCVPPRYHCHRAVTGPWSGLQAGSSGATLRICFAFGGDFVSECLSSGWLCFTQGLLEPSVWVKTEVWVPTRPS